MPFTLTTVVTIVPRYIMVNKMPHPILVSQIGSKQRVVLEPEKRFCYNFEHANKHSERKVAIGDPVPQGAEPKMSYPFFMEDIDDFQIPYSTESKEGGKTEWHEPSKENGFVRCVRVSITSEDNATLFIFFQFPSIERFCTRKL